MKMPFILKTILCLHSFVRWSLLLAFSFVLIACQGNKKEDKTPSPSGPEQTEAQKLKQKEKLEEQAQKRSALSRRMGLFHQSIEIASLSDSKLILRLAVRINSDRKALVYSTSLDKALKEQFDLQDKTEEISNKFPENDLEISSFKFSNGTAQYVALEYRFLKMKRDSTESSSQFVLMMLDKSLGDKAIVKTLFEYPTKSDLKTWAQKTETL